jgi:hypothetical protein
MIPPAGSPTAQSLANDAANSPQSNLGEKPTMGQKLEQLGRQQADEKSATEVRQTLTTMVNDALTPGKFSDLLDHLAANDRRRIGAMQGVNFEELNKTLAQFRNDFKQKYQQDFQFKAEYLDKAEINMGTTKDAVTASLSNLEKTPAVNPAPGAGARGAGLPSPLKTGETPGRDVASKTGLSVVSGPALVLVNEARQGGAEAAWKLDIPNEITGPQLRDTLRNHLQKIEDQKSMWSADKAATYRAVATEVFSALEDSSLATER